MPASRGLTSIVSALAVVGTIAVVPLGWRIALARWAPDEANAPLSYLPSVEARRIREPFDPEPLARLRQEQPIAIIMGDSMAGRIDPVRLSELMHGPVSTLVEPATGSSRWFLAFKNDIIPSGVRPRWVLVFFRDTNLTDPMFRLLEPYRQKTDFVALDREPELDRIVAMRMRGPWSRVHVVLDRAYDVDRARAWAEPPISPAMADLAAGAGKGGRLLAEMNDVFSLQNLRGIAQADLAAADDQDSDFAANINSSVLPLWVDLARAHDLRICFVKILRRPENGQPPPERPALQQYTRDLRAWLTARGMALLDDRDIRGMEKLPYADGDHLDGSAMTPYAELLYSELAKIK